jgi:tryptophanyl-tRNA synthetase
MAADILIMESDLVPVGRFRASPQLVASTREQLAAGGMGWGELKEQLFVVLNEHFAPLRDRYTELMEPGSGLDQVLEAGAQRAREHARPVMSAVRRAIGVSRPGSAKE